MCNLCVSLLCTFFLLSQDALSSWLYSDESLDGKDQYVIRLDNTSEVYWRDNNGVTLEVKKVC